MAEKDATTRLRRAVKENNLFVVKRLVKKTDMRNPDPLHKRYTSLAWAAVLGHEETFEFLLNAGHDDREYSKDSDNNTILILLADTKPPLTSPYGSGPSEHEFYSATLRMARLYLDRYPDILDWANVQGKTALHVAALKGNEELVRMLCDFGADFDLADNEGNTPLHYASAWGHIPIVQLLIERGCLYNVRNNDGFEASDYAYSTMIRDVLTDTARAQLEINRRRRNVYAQAAARGYEWGSSELPPPPPRMYHSTSGSARVRSGSGTSRTTTTSDSGDIDSYSIPQHARSQTPSNTLSPQRYPSNLPASSYSPGQPHSASSVSTFPASAKSIAPSIESNPASVLSPIANRMREKDADAMEKYKNRQRSGSATTASTTDASAASQSGSNVSPGPSASSDDELPALHTLMTVGSVAPRRRLRPSASAAQLRSHTPLVSPTNVPPTNQDTIRSRSGTGPAILKQASISSIPMSELPPTPTQQSTQRPAVSRTGSAHSGDPSKVNFTGPPSDYAVFPPPPPPKEPPEKPAQPSTPTHTTRRLPFNILSHRHHHEHSHKRNASLSSIGAKIA
ncbi:ankyrin [Panus rudis PR-1116 ss-1]|nr:ankyrin [Panus rudis PR-1116 ss-1]